MVAHPEGWHDVNRGLAASDARTVSVSEVPLPNVLTVSGFQTEAHPAGWTNGVVRARREGSVGDTTGLEEVVGVEDGVCCAASPPDDVGRLSAIGTAGLESRAECVVEESDVANSHRQRKAVETPFHSSRRWVRLGCCSLSLVTSWDSREGWTPERFGLLVGEEWYLRLSQPTRRLLI